MRGIGALVDLICLNPCYFRFVLAHAVDTLVRLAMIKPSKRAGMDADRGYQHAWHGLSYD